jgi:hypothetical protein
MFLDELLFSTQKMEAICSSETSVDTQQTTRCHTPEDDTLLRLWCSGLCHCVVRQVVDISEVHTASTFSAELDYGTM